MRFDEAYGIVYKHLCLLLFVVFTLQWKAYGHTSGLKLSPKKELRSSGLAGVAMAQLGNVEDVRKDVLNMKEEEEQTELIPILQHLLGGENLQPGWHRAAERLSRGICPPKASTVQLEVWEKQLAVMEMALVAGTETRDMNIHKVTKVLAHAWGREKGFHKLMIEKHCQRRGDLDRKKRVDAGTTMTAEKRANYRAKFEERKRQTSAVDQQQATATVEVPPQEPQEGETLYNGSAVSVAMPVIPDSQPVTASETETMTEQIAVAKGEEEQQLDQYEDVSPAPGLDLPPMDEPAMDEPTMEI